MTSNEGGEANVGDDSIRTGIIGGVDIEDDNINDRLSDILDDPEEDGSETQSLSPAVKAAMRAELEAARFETSGEYGSVTDLVIPTMGQLSKVNGKSVIISGGKPKADWSGLMNPQSHRSPFQIRELFSVSSKAYKHRCEKIHSTITKDSNLVVVGDTLKMQFEDIGVDTITYLPDPADPENTMSVLSDHAKLTKDEGIALSKTISSKFDSLDWENNGAATSVLLNSLDTKLYEKLIKNRNPDDTFVITWYRLVDLLYPHSISTFEEYKNVIRKRRATDYAGQDIEELCNDFENDAKKCSYHYDDELTMVMLETIMTAGGDSNEDFKAELRPLKKKLDKALMSIRFLDSASKDKYLEKEDLTVAKVLEECESQYRYLKSRGKWYPAQGVTDNAAPKIFSSNAEKNMNIAQVMALMANFQSTKTSQKSKGKKGNCNYCGQPGHWKSDCPLLKLKKKNQGAPSQDQKKKSWRRTPPASGSSETITKDGRTYYWCGICKRWTETHGTANHQVGFKKDSKNETSVDNANASLAVDASIWVCSAPLFGTIDIRNMLSEMFWFCIGLAAFAHSLEVVVNAFQVLIPIIMIFKRDLFMLSLSPLVCWLFYMCAKWYAGPSKRDKKYPRREHRRYTQHVFREHRRHRRRSSRGRTPRLGRQVPFRLRRQGVYAPRSQAPTVLEQNVMAMMRDLRFELIRTRNNISETSSARPRRHQGHRNRRRRSRNRMVHSTVSSGWPEQGPTLCMATSDNNPSQDALDKSSRLSSLLRTALQAPRRLINSMRATSTFPVIWDSGASHCVTFDKSDFISEVQDPGAIRRVKGIHSGLDVTGVGTVQWTLHDEKGGLRHLKLPALLVPKCTSRLLSTTVLLQQYENEHLIQHPTFMRLSGNPLVQGRSSVLVPIDKKSRLPKTTMHHMHEVKDAVAHLGETISNVREENLNLSATEKELLKWHYRLGHLSFRRIQSLLRTGIFSHSESSRLLHRSACRLRQPPKCAACLYGKQSARPIPNRSSTIVRDVGGNLLSGDLHPGQRTSIDHFICSTKGRRLESAGRTKEEKMFSGGIVFVDHASDFVFVDFCTSPNTNDSILSKEKYEAMCRDVGVVPQSYLSDNGKPFTSKEFTDSLSNLYQQSKFSGVGAHHSNGKAENTIKRIMAIARTMMIHSAIHWPSVADSSLWPLAVEYAVFLHNHVPHISNGLAPVDIFTRTRNPTRRLLDLHVWGSPTYVLDKVIADGKKLPRWKPRSTRRMFVGLSKRHSSKAPLVLNLETGYISPQFHVVHDDFFATVTSTPDLIPDFNSDVWKHLFGSATHYLSEDMDDETPDDNDNLEQMRAQRRQEGTAAQFDRQRPAQSLSVPPLPQTQLRVKDDFVVVQDPATTQVDDGSDFLIVDPPAPSPDIGRSSGRRGSSNNGITHPEGASDFPNPTSRNSQRIGDSTFNSTTPRVMFPEGVSASLNPRGITGNSVPLQRINRVTDGEESTLLNDTSENILNNFSDSNASTGRTARPTRTRRAPLRFSDEYDRLYTVQLQNCQEENSTGYLYVTGTVQPDVFTYDDILRDVARDKWMLAAVTEIAQLEAHDTWIEVPISEAQSKVLPGTWTFKLKRRPDGSVKKYKARFCVRGDLQEGDDETHAPVVAFPTVRIFLVLSLLLGWITCTVDFANAFVQAVLSSPVWIHLPRGFRSKRGGYTCLRLKKSLYGLKTAPRLWHQHIRSALLNELGFTVSSFDPCLFYRHNALAILYVDDLGLAFPSEDVLEDLLAHFKSLGFELTREGTFSEFLGIQFSFSQNGRSVTMTQGGLIEKILQTAGLNDCKPNKLPTSQVPLGNDEHGDPMVESWSYSSVVGMLLYLSTHTRPDVSFAVSQIARFTHNPKQSHAKAVKHLLRYLKGTRTQGITFQLPDEPLKSMTSLLIEDYVDSDFAGLYRVECPQSIISAKSRTGYIIFLCGCPLVWKSQLQTGVALSTQEAEYTALSQSVRTLIPIRHLVEEALKRLNLGPRLKIPQVICVAFEDNNGALSLATKHRLTSRTKYYHVNSHWFWGHVKDGKLHVKGISSSQQNADYLTKPLPFEPFGNNRQRVQGF